MLSTTRRRLIVPVLIFGLLVLPDAIVAQSDGSSTDTLIVATKIAPPFSMKGENGEWTGISIELWQKVADELDRPYRFVERDLAGMLEGVEKGEFDLAIAAISITSERESLFDFSQAYYQSGLGIAVAGSSDDGMLGVARRLFSTEFLSVIGLLLGVLALVGIIIWLAERKKNPEQFGGSPAHGIGSGLWWSAVTMTTVGYGDKAPVTVVGRIIGLIWMFAAIIIISSFTAGIAASLTVSEIRSEITGVDDLPNAKVAAVAGSTGSDWLGHRNISHRDVESIEDGLRDLSRGKIEALVYDAPMLKYLIRDGYEGRLAVLPGLFAKQFYGIALPPDSPLREEINRALLIHGQGEVWRSMVERYIGDASTN